MRLALFAHIQIDARRLLNSPWVHDTAHAFVAAKRRACYPQSRRPRKTT